MKKSDSCEEPLDEKANSRPAIRECREQSLQDALSCNGTALATAREALKGETEIILLGDRAFGRLKLDDSALKRDGDSMCPIAGAELRHKVADSAFDRCLRDK